MLLYVVVPLDNLKPKDSKIVIEEINRILKPQGKIILKLNPYFPLSKLEKDKNYKKVLDNFYKERTGLYLWNISNDLLKEIINPYCINAGKIFVKIHNYVNIMDVK